VSDKAKAWLTDRFPLWSVIGNTVEAHDGDNGMIRMTVDEVERLAL
jgi:hypothetical protein